MSLVLCGRPHKLPARLVGTACAQIPLNATAQPVPCISHGPHAALTFLIATTTHLLGSLVRGRHCEGGRHCTTLLCQLQLRKPVCP